MCKIKEIKANVIDLCLCYCFTWFLSVFLKNYNILISNVQLFLAITFTCQFIFAFNRNITIGKHLVRLNKASINKEPLKRKNDFYRFILEWCFYLVLPFLYQKIFDYKEFNQYIATVFIHYLLINGVALLFLKEQLFDFVFKTEYQLDREQKIFLGRNLAALIIDMSLLIPFTIIVRYLLWFYIDFVVLLSIIYIFYNIIAYSIFNASVGKYFMYITISCNKNNCINFILREIGLKLMTFLILPSLILYLCGFNDTSFLFLYSIIIFVLLIIPLSITINSNIHICWWNKLTNTLKIYHTRSSKGMFYKFGMLIAIWMMLFLGVRALYNKTQHSEKWLLGFNYPLEFFKYPNKAKLEKYTRFLQQPHLSPKEYVLRLFEKYDIVILGETLHGESLQWDLIADIVKDTRFIETAGNIFTEYGAVSKQSNVNVFLKTQYPNDSLLSKATATLTRTRGSYYNFLKNINLFNSKLNDNSKLNVWFTDNIFFNSYIKKSLIINKDEYLSYVTNRDSLMANVVISWYNKSKNTKKHKCLVITNYRHAFGLVSDTNRFKNNPIYKQIVSENEAQYIFRSFPNQTANVMLNWLSYNGCFYMPIQNGKWERAFELNGNKTLGFNFKNSPFGSDAFDFYPTMGYNGELKYQDIYTGFIFFAPLKDYKTQYDYPYKKYAAEQEYLNNPKAYYKEIAYKDISMYSDKCDMNNERYFDFFKFIIINQILLFLFTVFLSFIILSIKLMKQKA